MHDTNKTTILLTDNMKNKPNESSIQLASRSGQRMMLDQRNALLLFRNMTGSDDVPPYEMKMYFNSLTHLMNNTKRAIGLFLVSALLVYDASQLWW